MEFLNSPIKKEEQLEKIMEDTEKIIKNFKEAIKIIPNELSTIIPNEISTIIPKEIEDYNDPMYSLGKRIINSRKEKEDSCNDIGNTQINDLF